MPIKESISLEEIAIAGQMAAALEVCGWPKPGNVHRTADFQTTTFEHFVAGAVAIGPALRQAARRGFNAGEGRIDVEGIRLGSHIKKAVDEVSNWHKGGNTHLGVAMLLVPLAAATGFILGQERRLDVKRLRHSIMAILKSTNVDDAINLYATIRNLEQSWTGRLGSQGFLDVFDPSAEEKLKAANISLFDVMNHSSKWDNIAKELGRGMPISFTLGYPIFAETYRRTGDTNISTVHTFLTILAKHPDTFIARKIGLENTQNIREAVKIGLSKAREVSGEAGEVLKLGGLLTEEGKLALLEFDKKLRHPNNELNPGTSADMTTSSLMIAILLGFRP